MDYLQKKSIRSVAAAITGFLRHSVRKIGITREKLPSCIALAVCPLVTFYLFEMYTHNPFTTMHFKTQLLNMAFYVLTALLLFGILPGLLIIAAGAICRIICGFLHIQIFHFHQKCHDIAISLIHDGRGKQLVV